MKTGQESAEVIRRPDGVRPPGGSMRVLLGGAAVDLVPDPVWLLDEVAGRLQAPARRRLNLASANIDHLHHFGSGGEQARDLFDGDDQHEWLVLLDGVPLIWRAEHLTGHPWPQLAGSTLLPDLLALAERTQAPVGLLGGTPAQHHRLGAVLPQRFPDLCIAGMWAPPREVIQDPAASRVLADQVRDSGCSLLVVGLGKPLQERWVADHGARTGARVTACFGAAADFLAGSATRCPAWVSRAGLEWSYRLAREPRRLARRYLLEGPPAVVSLVQHSSVHECVPATVGQRTTLDLQQPGRTS